MAATKINLMRTINVNVVRGQSYENVSYKSFLTQKFPDLRYLLFYGECLLLFFL